MYIHTYLPSTFLQVKYGEGNPGVAIETNELTHGLVIALEALFIHSLKKQSSRAVKASSLRNLPGPSFWTFVLVFSHKETISHLEKLTAITTDIGKGRAWIRLALNDGFLCSYLSAMASDKDSLEKHYNRNALLRDSDTMDVFIRYLRGIEIYRFDIALNSGLLNRWATAPLILAGLVISENANEPSTPTATGKSLLEAFILTSTNPQYDKRLFIDLPVQYMKTTSSEHGGEHVVHTNCFLF